jgi:hypothetical protein
LNDEARGKEFIKVDGWMDGWMDDLWPPQAYPTSFFNLYPNQFYFILKYFLPSMGFMVVPQ